MEIKYTLRSGQANPKEMIDRFGEKLRQLRLDKGLNQTTLAHRLGYRTQAYLSELESGKKKPTAEFVLKVSRFFNVSCDVLLKDELDLEDLDAE